MKNLGTTDRLLRVILAEVCILIAFFWVGDEWQIPIYLIAAVLLLQAATATCSINTLLGWNSCETVKRRNKNLMAVFVVAALLLAVAGSYASAVITRNVFLGDAESVNASYSMTMQSLDEGNRENATMQYGMLESSFGNFSKKYSKYRPLTIKYDGNFTGDMNNISAGAGVGPAGAVRGPSPAGMVTGRRAAVATGISPPRSSVWVKYMWAMRSIISGCELEREVLEGADRDRGSCRPTPGGRAGRSPSPSSRLVRRRCSARIRGQPDAVVRAHPAQHLVEGVVGDRRDQHLRLDPTEERLVAQRLGLEVGREHDLGVEGDVELHAVVERSGGRAGGRGGRSTG